MNCNFCKTNLQADATVCHACARQVVGKDCPSCAERVLEAANVCRYCAHEFANTAPTADIEAFTVKGDALGTALMRFRLLVQQVDVQPDKIIIETPGFLGLSKAVEELPWKKIAGYNFNSGIFWDRIIIETRGQTANTVYPLNKQDSERIRAVLSEMKS